MKILSRRGGLLLLTVFLVMSPGCKRSPSRVPGPPADAAEQAKFKADAMRRLADAMAKDADSPDSRAAFEDFRNQPLDIQTSPKEAEEILSVYQQRISGKYEGEVMEMVRLEMAGIEAGLKKAN